MIAVVNYFYFIFKFLKSSTTKRRFIVLKATVLVVNRIVNRLCIDMYFESVKYQIVNSLCIDTYFESVDIPIIFIITNILDESVDIPITFIITNLLDVSVLESQKIKFIH